MGQLDRLRGSALAERLNRSAAARRLFAVTRAGLVRERLAFVVAEIARGPRPRTYTLREGGRRVVVRHDADGATILNEIFWWGWYDPPLEAERVLPAPGAAARVADLGANSGLYGVWCLRRWPEAEIVAYEPDPESARACRIAIAANRAGPRWDLREQCAGVAPGEVSFVAGEGGASHVAGEGEPGTIRVPIVDVFDSLRGRDLIKIDIEGSEWPILEDPRMAGLDAGAIVLEFHGGGSDEEAPVDRCRRLLARAGYDGFRAGPLFRRELGMAWAWRSGSQPAALGARRAAT